MDSNYEEKFDEYIKTIKNLMITFEVTKCCGYSTFVCIYKEETLFDLYRKVSIHFDCDVVELFFLTSDSLKRIPLSNKTILKFINENIICNPQLLIPIYQFPQPIVYRIFLNDGDHCNHQKIIENIDDHCKNYGKNCNV